MELLGATTPLAALAAGLVTSLHCAGMCGPFGCVLLAGGGARPPPASAPLAAYHGSRLLAYTALGLVAGAVGTAALGWIGFAPVLVLPWLFAALFFAYALGLDRRLPKPAWVSRGLLGPVRRAAAWPAVPRGAVLGAVTPLIPCGPLYLMVTVAAFAGSALAGAGLLLAFALGTIPALWLAQSQYFRIRGKLSPLNFVRLQRGVAAAAGLLLLWRGWHGLGAEASGLICL